MQRVKSNQELTQLGAVMFSSPSVMCTQTRYYVIFFSFFPIQAQGLESRPSWLPWYVDLGDVHECRDLRTCILQQNSYTAEKAFHRSRHSPPHSDAAAFPSPLEEK